MANLKPDCPKCKHNKRVTEWMKKLGNNIWLCEGCKLTFDPDRPKEHQVLDCPLCGAALVYQPTVALDYRTATCYGMKVNTDGKTSSSVKCGYKVTFRDGILDNQEWTGQRKEEDDKSRS